ncbi:MAG: MFS transporter [Gammaproteobacteria bacterium]|nr:MFS transporter [Gammaproteobacteria bacterium]MBI5618133.1 MFS transporter [Gammaproteobacteria bacterium]
MTTTDDPAGAARNASAPRRLTVVTLLGVSSGLPLALADSTLQAWLTVRGLDVKTIGALSLIGLPYVLKFLWAPLLDHFALLPGLDRRRGWILGAQLALAALLFALSGLDPAVNLATMAALVLLMAVVSATQDTVIDAYRSEILPARERGLGAGLAVAGYRVAMILSGAGALVLAHRFGFNLVYAGMAVLMGSGVLATLAGPRPIAVAAVRPALWESVVLPLREFLRRDGALALLALVALYKLGDALAARLTMTFFIRELGFTLLEIGAIYKGLGIGASLVGGIFGGALMMRLGLRRALWLFAILQAVTNAGFFVLALHGKSMAGMIAVVGLENLAAGMGTSALVALITGLCDLRYTATQFALLTAVASLARVLSGPVAGELAALLGWPRFFLCAVALALPAMALLHVLKPRLAALETADATAR